MKSVKLHETGTYRGVDFVFDDGTHLTLTHDNHSLELGNIEDTMFCDAVLWHPGVLEGEPLYPSLYGDDLSYLDYNFGKSYILPSQTMAASAATMMSTANALKLRDALHTRIDVIRLKPVREEVICNDQRSRKSFKRPPTKVWAHLVEEHGAWKVYAVKYPNGEIFHEFVMSFYVYCEGEFELIKFIDPELNTIPPRKLGEVSYRLRSKYVKLPKIRVPAEPKKTFKSPPLTHHIKGLSR